jgi:hypothetical protein
MLITLPACVSSGARVGSRHALRTGTDLRALEEVSVEWVGHLVVKEGLPSPQPCIIDQGSDLSVKGRSRGAGGEGIRNPRHWKGKVN